MWRRTYLFLILVRLYFALSTSYLHPDENFQGPEVVAGRIFSYPVHETWDFTAEKPIRSAFPLWPVYGLPMLILRWLWEGTGQPEVAPSVVFWTLRVLMFMLSFVLEDWAVYELFDSPRQRRLAILLVASSYVTWTWQVHTFSNSIETLLVAWSLVLIKRIIGIERQQFPILAPAILAVLLVFATFNRPTFPVFIAVPGLYLIPHFWKRPYPLLVMIVFGLATMIIAITVDTAFYSTGRLSFQKLIHEPVITPWNNFQYNIHTSNLALHGTHPFFQHFLVNIPQLLGPAFLLLFWYPRWWSLTFISAISGTSFLSLIPHQEARFLLPTVPLLLASVQIPKRHIRWCFGIWIIFNTVLGFLMGVYHQGGIVPAQIWLERQDKISQAFWWKTYSPPTWLLNGRNEEMTTVDLMGLNKDLLEDRVCSSAKTKGKPAAGSVLVAPRSALYLDRFKDLATDGRGMHLKERWSHRGHINLDDLDFGDDGVWATLARVLGRRGLVVWEVTC